MRLIAIFIAALLTACGSNIRDKEPNSSTSNGTTEPNNATSSNASTNDATNGGTATNNGSNSGTNSGTNTMTTGGTCDILTSESASDYCNLQATCGEQSLLVECILDGSWLCYCGMEAVELDENPCSDPDAYAPQLARECDTGSTATMSGCQSSSFENLEYECSYGVMCADEHEYAVACDTDEQTETSECQCFVDGEPSESFTAEGLTCRVGNDDLSWWNDGCGWELSRQ